MNAALSSGSTSGFLDSTNILTSPLVRFSAWRIAETIRSAYELVDEIILVDAASTDGTIQEVEALDKDKKATIYREDNPPNFIINKQRL